MHDVISSVAVDWIDMDVRNDSTSHGGRIIRHFAGRAPLLRTLAFYCILQPTGSIYSDVMSGMFVRLIVPTKCVTFRDPVHLNRSGEVRSKAVGSGIPHHFRDNLRPEAASDVISGVGVEWVGTDNSVNGMIIGQTFIRIFEPLTL